MKIAVTAVADSLTAEMDPRFGRARWIALHDTENGETEFLDNIAGVEATGGAGGGYARLTDEGRRVVNEYKELRSRFQNFLKQV